MKDPVMFNF